MKNEWLSRNVRSQSYEPEPCVDGIPPARNEMKERMNEWLSRNVRPQCYEPEPCVDGIPPEPPPPPAATTRPPPQAPTRREMKFIVTSCSLSRPFCADLPRLCCVVCARGKQTPCVGAENHLHPQDVNLRDTGVHFLANSATVRQGRSLLQF